MKSTIAATVLVSSLTQGVQVKSKAKMGSMGQSLAQLKAPALEPANFDDSTPTMDELTNQQRENAAEET